MARAQRAFRRWPEVVGPFLATRSWPDRFSRGTVWVAVEGSSWAQELRMLKGQILSRLREVAADRALFQDVRFGVRRLPDSRSVNLADEEVRRSEEMRGKGTVAEMARKWRGARPNEDGG